MERFRWPIERGLWVCYSRSVKWFEFYFSIYTCNHVIISRDCSFFQCHLDFVQVHVEKIYHATVDGRIFTGFCTSQVVQDFLWFLPSTVSLSLCMWYSMPQLHPRWDRGIFTSRQCTGRIRGGTSSAGGELHVPKPSVEGLEFEKIWVCDPKGAFLTSFLYSCWYMKLAGNLFFST